MPRDSERQAQSSAGEDPRWANPTNTIPAGRSGWRSARSSATDRRSRARPRPAGRRPARRGARPGRRRARPGARLLQLGVQALGRKVDGHDTVASSEALDLRREARVVRATIVDEHDRRRALANVLEPERHSVVRQMPHGSGSADRPGPDFRPPAPALTRSLDPTQPGRVEVEGQDQRSLVRGPVEQTTARGQSQLGREVDRGVPVGMRQLVSGGAPGLRRRGASRPLTRRPPRSGPACDRAPRSPGRQARPRRRRRPAGAGRRSAAAAGAAKSLSSSLNGREAAARPGRGRRPRSPTPPG